MAHADQQVESKEDVLKFAAKYGTPTRLIIDGWLTQENTELAAKDWNGFARLIEKSSEYELTTRVFEWLENKKHAEQAAKDWGGFAEVIEYGGMYKRTAKTLKWLETAENLENAAKFWKGFAKLLKYMKLKHRLTHPIFKWLKESAQVRQSEDWGDFGKGLHLAITAGQEEVIFEWLENPANLKKATEHGEKFLILINRIRSSNRLGIMLNLLTTEDSEQTAKNWRDFIDFTSLQRDAKENESNRQSNIRNKLPIKEDRNRDRDNIRVIYHDLVFDWIEDPKKIKENASNWGFTEESKEILVNWLENPEHVEHAKKDWLGFSSLANEAKETDRGFVLFTWLEDKKNLKKVSPDWRELTRIVASAKDVGTLQLMLNRR